MAEPRAIVPIKGIRPGLNSSGNDLATNVFVQLVPGVGEDPPEIRLPAGAGEPAYGVVFSSTVRVDVSPDVGIPDGQIGDIQVDGRAIVLASGGIPVGSIVEVTTTGAVIIAFTSGGTPVGKALTAGVDGELFEIELIGPGAGGQTN